MSRIRSSSSARLHIALVSPALPASGLANGIVTYVVYMRDALRAAGHRVSVITSYAVEDARGQEHAIPPLQWMQKLLTRSRIRLQPDRRDILGSSVAIAAAVRYVHARDPIDVVEVEETFGWTHVLSRLGPRIVIRLHGPHLYGRDRDEAPDDQRRSDRREIEEARAMTRAAALTCPSARLLAATLAHFHLEPRIAETIPNPMPAAADNRRWQRSEADPSQILTIGRFDTRKGADIVLKAFEHVARQRDDARLILVGPDTGLATTTGTRINFHQFVSTEISPEVRSRITFLGEQSPAEIETLRRRCAFSVIGSRFENFPYSLAEAMALGTASIVSDSFGNGEMVQDGQTGLVVPIGDVDAMARAMLRLHDDPEQTAGMPDAAWRRCRSWLDPDRVARETAVLYRRAGA